MELIEFFIVIIAAILAILLYALDAFRQSTDERFKNAIRFLRPLAVLLVILFILGLIGELLSIM